MLLIAVSKKMQDELDKALWLRYSVQGLLGRVRKKTNACEANMTSVGKNQVRDYDFYSN